MKRFGVIDIGSIKVKLLIVEQQDSGDFSPIYQSTNMTRLGLKLEENNFQPLPENLQSTIDELKKVKKVLQDAEVDDVRVVSTHALREMVDGVGVAKTLSDKTGLKVEIITQQQEAELFFNAVMRDFNVQDDFAMVDVGSGSVQLLIGHKGEMSRTYLFKTGTVYLFEKYTQKQTENDFPTEEEIERMRQYILEQLVPVPLGINAPLIYGSNCIIEVFKIMGIPLQEFKHSNNHPYQTPISALEQFLEKVVYMPYKERLEKYYFKEQPYYMWGIDTALLNVLTIGKHLGSDYVIPSNASISHGLLLSLAKAKT